MQTTLAASARFSGNGLHSGEAAQVIVRPAPAWHGIVFRRVDADIGDGCIAAHWKNVSNTRLSTQISNADGVSVATVEHLMAALWGCGIHNAMIEIDGPEVPILDGSALPFVQGLLKAGIQPLAAPLDVVRLKRSVTVRRGDAFARLEPSDRLRIEFRIAFEGSAIGAQERRADFSNGRFVRDFCDSRTFCRLKDVEDMRSADRALGGNFSCAVVFDANGVLNDGGLRHPDEPVRHKMLDALGDLATVGCPILAQYTGHKAGHSLTNLLLREVFGDPENFERVRCTKEVARNLPGAGLVAADLAAVA